MNEQIDKSIGHLIHTKGDQGFTYLDVETRVRTALSGQIQSLLVELGSQKLRDKIRQRARHAASESMDGLIQPHPSLFDEELFAIYPVKGQDGDTLFKQFTHLGEEEVGDVIRELISQRKGLDRHIRALRRVERRLKPIWAEFPGLIIAEAQEHLLPLAAE